MPGNSFGQALVLSSWGESHGPAIGGVLDGLPPGLEVDEARIQEALDRRAPGRSRFVSQRREEDRAEILSGLWQGRSTGQPLAFRIANSDARSRDYDELARLFRPSHADWSWQQKYGIRDPRGGGRSSARETAVRVAAGAVAMMVLEQLLPAPPVVRGALAALGGDEADAGAWDWDGAAKSPLFCPDAAAAPRWEALLDGARKERNSLGALAYVEASGIPAGLGEPVYDRLDADLAKALMSINAVKGVEIGAGFAAAAMRGEEHADEMRAPGPVFLSNRAGGILGGVSTGETIVARFALKPTSSIPRPLRTI